MNRTMEVILSNGDLERRSIYNLPAHYWTNYKHEAREVYLVPLYDAVWRALEVRGAATPGSNALAVAQALGLEVQEDDGTLWASSDTVDLVASKIFRWEVASYSALKDEGLESLFPLNLRVIPAEESARMAEDLGDEYEPDTGFIGRLRYGKVFDPEKAERYLSTLASLKVDDSSSLELVRIIWHLPLMLQMQLDWAEPGSEYHRQISNVLDRTINILEETVGIP